MEFNLTRFWNLSKRDFLINMKTDVYILSTMGIINGIAFSPSRQSQTFFSFFILLLLGFNIFKEYVKKASRTNILLLPVSNIERFLVVFARGFIYYPILLFIFFILGSLVVNIGAYSLGLSTSIFYVQDIIPATLKEISYSFTHLHFVFCIYFFGSIFYKKNAGLKMTLLLSGLTILVFVLYILISYLFEIRGISYGFNMVINPTMGIEVFVAAIISIVLICLAYLRLTEEEV